MKHKGKVLDLFVEWKKDIKKNTRRKIKVLRSENSGSTPAIFPYSYAVIRA